MDRVIPASAPVAEPEAGLERIAAQPGAASRIDGGSRLQRPVGA
ncbi:MAG: hypothetical protein ACOVNL_08320 [Prochlorococcaceae cyanobacterium]